MFTGLHANMSTGKHVLVFSMDTAGFLSLGKHLVHHLHSLLHPFFLRSPPLGLSHYDLQSRIGRAAGAVSARRDLPPKQYHGWPYVPGSARHNGCASRLSIETAVNRVMLSRTKRVSQDNILKKRHKAGSIVRPENENVQFWTVEPLRPTRKNRPKFGQWPITVKSQSIQEGIRKRDENAKQIKTKGQRRTETQPERQLRPQTFPPPGDLQRVKPVQILKMMNRHTRGISLYSQTKTPGILLYWLTRANAKRTGVRAAHPAPAHRLGRCIGPGGGGAR